MISNPEVPVAILAPVDKSLLPDLAFADAFLSSSKILPEFGLLTGVSFHVAASPVADKLFSPMVCDVTTSGKGISSPVIGCVSPE